MHMIGSYTECASRVRGLLGGNMVLSELLGSVMARAGFGLLLATPNRGIVYANDMADTLMPARNSLRCERNSITAKDSTASRKLQSLIVATSRRTDELAQRGTLIVRDENGALSLAVHVVPLCQNSAAGPFNKQQSVAGFVIVDCQQALLERIGAFADLFALTPGEARVAAQLISEGGVTKAASRLNIALSTARTHLQRIMEKTGTHSQTELVKVFYQVTLPWYGYRCAEGTSSIAAAGRRLRTGLRT